MQTTFAGQLNMFVKLLPIHERFTSKKEVILTMTVMHRWMQKASIIEDELAVQPCYRTIRQKLHKSYVCSHSSNHAPYHRSICFISAVYSLAMSKGNNAYLTILIYMYNHILTATFFIFFICKDFCSQLWIFWLTCRVGNVVS
ncbi:hypothetical protein K450DRAFT_225421 [Umbelopsis ramanniana AG]|uniref:Uncharacterized protein n=1 Tax=Umbelopsis ramanniana AG TaxID=1314678 RepID=A0AAD5EFG8_UMBRA|nr:uncharacterized protein K450DRAFT_225421 [Umbelopsis ramanniana AG]KAI8582913.1 hypothetical protein K450DRAFT_225421 [Umbelopsis ramanniana AG]